MLKITLPYRHYYYLKILSSLRRESVQEAIAFLYNNIDEDGNNWIDTRFAHYTKPPVDIDVTDIKVNVSEATLMRKIQALPNGIKPITDGPYSFDVDFEEDKQYSIIRILGYKIYDYKENRNTDRISRIYPLVADKFPFAMTIGQYGSYRDAGSQFWRLIQEKDKETMPKSGEIAMDVGAHIGYRALAMHHCVGSKGKVYAIEVEDENYQLLQKNIEANNLSNMVAFQEAIDSTSRTATLYTRDKQSMAHGLKSFEAIEDPSAIDRKQANNFTKEVNTLSMDDLFKKYGIEKVDNMHISVTGHEIEVLNGINTILPQLKKLRVSCPYKTNGVPNIDTAKEILEQKGFSNFNTHGSAIIGER